MLDPERVQEAVNGALFPTASEPGGGAGHRTLTYSLWEKKTWRLHRGLIYLELSEIASAAEIEEGVREVVAQEFTLKWTWLRGFAFGAVVKIPAFPEDLARVERSIDIRNRLKGVFQWIIVTSDPLPLAFGIHTWTEGYLSPTFRALVGDLVARGIPCPTFVRDKSKFFAFAQKVIALGGARVPEFRS